MILLKKSNYHIIKDFCLNRARQEMKGNKIQALYNLIQKKGEKLTAPGSECDNLPALEISAGEFIAIKRTAPGLDFYPCAIKIYHIQHL